ncbi:MAG: peptidogalycan biosysnthesis protein [Bacteroidota bacterium]|nr:peptidogalycan biosysnthesis protein [Bacteroidota bacterium]
MPKFSHCNIFTVEIFHQQNEVYQTWKNVLPEGHYLLSSEYHVLENSLLDGFRYYYVNIYDKNKQLIALFYFQLIALKSENFKTKSCVETSMLKFMMGFKNNHLMVCGNVFKVNQPGYFFINQADTSHLTDLILKIKKQISNKYRILGILLKDCSNHINVQFYTCNAFVPFNEDITMMLNIKPKWQTIGDYCESLKRKYKQRFQKVKNSASSLNIRELNSTEIEANKIELEKLYTNVLDKQSFTLGKINANYFVEMKKHLADNFKIFAYFKENEIIAFSSHIQYPKENEMEIHYIGINYLYNQEYQLYFNILCDGVKLAIENRFDRLELGRTAKDAKANLGAIPLFNHNYIWLKSRFLRSMLRIVINQQSKNEDKDWLNRQPFKMIDSSVDKAVNIQ